MYQKFKYCCRKGKKLRKVDECLVLYAETHLRADTIWPTSSFCTSEESIEGMEIPPAWRLAYQHAWSDMPKLSGPGMFKFLEKLGVRVDVDLLSVQPEYRRQVISVTFANKDKCRQIAESNAQAQAVCRVEGKEYQAKIRMAGDNAKKARILDLPYKLPHQLLASALAAYGAMKSAIRCETWTAISTGTSPSPTCSLSVARTASRQWSCTTSLLPSPRTPGKGLP